MRTVSDLRALADQRLFSGDHLGALHAYTTLVQLQPIHLGGRLRIADALLALGEVQRAAFVYTAFARHAAHGGYPLLALVALKVLSALEPQLEALLAGIGELYSVESQRVGRGVRLAPADPDQPLPEGFALTDPPPPLETLAPLAEQLGRNIEAIAAYPEHLPPIPLFSELPADSFAMVLHALKLVRTAPGQPIVKEGDPGNSFYMLARGSVRITKQSADGPPVQLATLHDGSIFGEMALVSASPRTATVEAVTDCDLLEFEREALTALSRDAAPVARALEKFTRERLLHNLLSTAALFKPLDRKQRLDLARRFTAHDLAPGVDIIREGTPGTGVFVLLSGEADVSKVDGEEKVLLATLKAGDVFGEMSLLNDAPTSATVTAAAPSTVLFLAREYFQKLMEAVPAIRTYIEGLSDERLMDTRILLDASDAEDL